MLDQPVSDADRKQFSFEKVECKSKSSPNCSGSTVRVRSRKREDTEGLCSACTSHLIRVRRAAWRERKDEMGVPRSTPVKELTAA